MTLQDKVLAMVRTAAAAAVGYLLVWLAARWHIVLAPHDAAWVQGAALVVATAVYQAAASWVQRRWPAWTARVPVLSKVAWLVALLLVSAQQPVYVNPAIAARRPAAAGR